MRVCVCICVYVSACVCVCRCVCTQVGTAVYVSYCHMSGTKQMTSSQLYHHLTFEPSSGRVTNIWASHDRGPENLSVGPSLRVRLNGHTRQNVPPKLTFPLVVVSVLVACGGALLSLQRSHPRYLPKWRRAQTSRLTSPGTSPAPARRSCGLPPDQWRVLH